MGHYSCISLSINVYVCSFPFMEINFHLIKKKKFKQYHPYNGLYNQFTFFLINFWLHTNWLQTIFSCKSNNRKKICLHRQAALPLNSLYFFVIGILKWLSINLAVTRVLSIRHYTTIYSTIILSSFKQVTTLKDCRIFHSVWM